MKKALSFILAVVLVASVLPFSLTASATATSGYYTYSVSNGEATITEVSTSISGDVTIPSNLGGYPVTSIGEYAFEYCAGLTSITIPNSVISIGYGAFYYCTGLTSITIPNSVTSIGDDAFYGCSGLTSITIPNSVTSIGENAFFGCTGLTSITVEEGNTVYHSKNNCLIETESKTLILGCKNSIIPTDGSVTSIGSWAFYDCTGLTSITISNSVTSIGDYAFYHCEGLTSVTIGNSVTSIGERAFSYCTGLASIKVEKGNTVYHSENNCLIETESKTLISGCKNSVIPSDGSVTSIGWAAFDGCTGLTSITIPNSVTSIGWGTFYDCTGLTSITIPNSVTSIGGDAFERCTGLTSITIPNSVTSIGEGAFYDCTGLTSITIGNSVTSIGWYAFYGCTGLEDVWYTGSEEDRNNNITITEWNNECLLNATWHYNYVPTPEIKYGLVTENEEISASDALSILHAVVGKIEITDAQKTAGDVDGNGIINATDALTILHFIVGKIDKFPVEG